MRAVGGTLPLALVCGGREEEKAVLDRRAQWREEPSHPIALGGGGGGKGELAQCAQGINTQTLPFGKDGVGKSVLAHAHTNLIDGK